MTAPSWSSSATGINAPELGWNDYAGIDMKGKVAVILVNDPDYAMEPPANEASSRAAA